MRWRPNSGRTLLPGLIDGDPSEHLKNPMDSDDIDLIMKGATIYKTSCDVINTNLANNQK
jgi:hypothetical protein